MPGADSRPVTHKQPRKELANAELELAGLHCLSRWVHATVLPPPAKLLGKGIIAGWRDGEGGACSSSNPLDGQGWQGDVRRTEVRSWSRGAAPCRGVRERVEETPQRTTAGGAALALRG